MIEPHADLLDWAQAREARDAALDTLEARRARYVKQARAIADDLARQGYLVSVNMIREVLPPPAEFDGRVMGAIMRPPKWAALEQGESERVISHGRKVMFFFRRPDVA